MIDTTERAAPHDLLWPTHVTRWRDRMLPGWADQLPWWSWPLVVRRAPSRKDGAIAVGLRGWQRSQRHATWLLPAEVARRLTPAALVEERRWRDHQKRYPQRVRLAVFAGLEELISEPPFGDHDWGVAGSVGFELATGHGVAGADSDLDLVVMAPFAIARDQARQWLAVLDRLSVRCDVQLQTPCGGFALREWAGGMPRVLLKTAAGPCLVSNPWTHDISAMCP